MLQGSIGRMHPAFCYFAEWCSAAACALAAATAAKGDPWGLVCCSGLGEPGAAMLSLGLLTKLLPGVLLPGVLIRPFSEPARCATAATAPSEAAHRSSDGEDTPLLLSNGAGVDRDPCRGCSIDARL